MKYIVYEDSSGKFRWRLMSRNGRIVADSGEGYERRSGAEKAAKRCWEINQSSHFVMET